MGTVVRPWPLLVPSSSSTYSPTQPRCQPIELLVAHPFRTANSCLALSTLAVGNWRSTESHEATNRSLTPENSVAPGLAEVESHHLRHVEQRQAIRSGGIQSLFIQPQRYTSRPARFHESDQIGQRFSDAIDPTRSAPCRSRRDRIASISASSPGRRSFFTVAGRSVNTLGNRPSTLTGNRLKTLDLILCATADNQEMIEHRLRRGLSSCGFYHEI